MTGLWKTVEKKENSARCCSACTGDYEDPDESVWLPDPEEDEGDMEVTRPPRGYPQTGDREVRGPHGGAGSMPDPEPGVGKEVKGTEQ